MIRTALLAGAALLAVGSATLAVAAPEDLLPDSFGAPPPAPVPAPGPTTSPDVTVPARPDRTPAPDTGPAAGPAPVIQPLPGVPPVPDALPLPEDFPSLAELEAMEPDEIDELLGLRPKFDIPPAARRALRRVGVMSSAEGGFPARSLAGQPQALVRAALQASDGPLVSRWGHILLRRVLASRLDAPSGMAPVDFAALRARALNAMGESAVARRLVQDVDGSNYNRLLTDAAFDSYLRTGDLLGMCPVARLQAGLREDGQWELLQAICLAYLGDTRTAERQLQRALGTGLAPEIDVRLAQRYAGAAGEGRRAVNIEWDGVDTLTPWRFALARALGVEIPPGLREAAGRPYDLADVLIPATPLMTRVELSDRAAGRGVFSAAAMVDLYSQLWASDEYAGEDKALPRQLRQAYVASNVADRLAAMRALWGSGQAHGRAVLTAYAAARVPVSDELLADAPQLIGSMLTAGLDRNALRWGAVVPEGSAGWALLTLAQPTRQSQVDEGALDTFVDNDESIGQRKSRFLLAGLAGLGRISPGAISSFSARLEVNFERRSPWSERITRAAEVGNPALVALLAGVGMRGQSWDQMTARQLYLIVRSLDQAGLGAEARMIAAEAVARA